MNPTLAPFTDSQLVADSLHGSREAFGELVTRHQQAVCAIGFARTGSLAASEDIAQETFLAAWKNLAQLQSPDRFRAWICGTARHLASRFYREQKGVSPLTEELPDSHMAPCESVISREEEALMWTALESLPENHREPIVLFYRSGQSVREIAEALELSEDAVKQRLSRGRVMLQEAVREKVESVLARSRPGTAFTLTVLAAIPVAATSAQAAGAGVAVAKGAGATAAAGLLPMLGGLFIGLAGAWFGIKSSLDHAESERERAFVRRAGLWNMSGIIAMIAILMALVFWARPFQAAHPGLWVFLMAANILTFCSLSVILGRRCNREQNRIRAEERLKLGLPAENSACTFEYRSRWKFLGLPLVHCRFGGPGMGVAKGWIAWAMLPSRPSSHLEEWRSAAFPWAV